MIVGLAAVLPTAPAWAQDSTPSPEELWEAYPLEPGQAAPTASADASPVASVAAPGREAGQQDDGGAIPLAVPIGLAALLALGAGVGFGRRRRQRPAEVVEAPPVTPRRFQWRDYPPPARPAPPPPPVPGRPPPFEAGLEEARRAPALRPKHEERR